MATEITEYKKCDGWVFYDASCRLCTTMARRFFPLLARRRLKLLPLQTPWVAARLGLRDSELLAEMRFLRRDGRFFGGADALLEIARHFWWAWPLGQIGRIPTLKVLLRAGYRWVARQRSCGEGSCSTDHIPNVHATLVPPALRRRGLRCTMSLPKLSVRQRRFTDFLPLLLLPILAMFLRSLVAPWIFMWAMALALYAGCKWLTYREARRHGILPRLARAMAYLLAWPGMDATDFLDIKMAPAKSQKAEWLFALAKISVGFILLWAIARLFFPAYPLLAGWTGMIGIVFILHFGLFHLLSLCWRHAGITATPLMQNPIISRSLAEFWGRRWNIAFNQLAFQFTFRPFRRFTTPTLGILLVFGLSGLIHDLLISVPAHGGYGWPTLYFLIQGAGVIAERSRFGRRIGLGRGARGRFFTFIVTIAPVCRLFHPPFIYHVILPMLTAIGAT